MANKYGQGYYNNFDEMMISLEAGLREALEGTAKRLCEDMNEIIKENIYNTPEGQYYERTFEMYELKEYMTYEINGLQCVFKINGEEIETLDVENPPHHALEEYSGESFLEYLSPDHKDFIFNCKRWIEAKYKWYYQEECRKRNIRLE